MVPGSLGWGSAVLAAMTMLAPSRAALRAMALPIPRLAPVINSVLPASLLGTKNGNNVLSQIPIQDQLINYWLVNAKHLRRWVGYTWNEVVENFALSVVGRQSHFTLKFRPSLWHWHLLLLYLIYFDKYDLMNYSNTSQIL